MGILRDIWGTEINIMRRNNETVAFAILKKYCKESRTDYVKPHLSTIADRRGFGVRADGDVVVLPGFVGAGARS
jgi:hypothetical protein